MGTGAEAALISGGILSAGGSLMSGISGYSQGKAQSTLYKGQAAALALNEAVLAEQYGFQQEQLEDRYLSGVRQVVGETETQAAHSGVKMTGSVAEALSASLEALEKDQAIQRYTLKSNYISAKYGNRQGVLSAQYGAKTAKIQGRTALTSGVLNAAASGLSTYGTYYGLYGGDSGAKSSSGAKKEG